MNLIPIEASYQDLEKLQGKYLVARQGDHEIEGKLVGLGNGVIAIGPDEVARPWLLQGAEEDNEFYPKGWKLYERVTG